ncbi:hypothetical protein SAMN00120144_1958 [Hymenobacter roseosalivarius DSM 11622]|uniref:Uncharacterized protein n=1 Tax=Hymenobacter roseosalivarius DSM 11622 TaxID=645990 RepID=A0A1W1W5F9_9BACT|nr:hypothetical protein SAMN00120144_1958 [Hymenobacter roseosalivarius DSM 11622]
MVALFTLTDTKSITIVYDRANDWLYAEWKGHQD